MLFNNKKAISPLVATILLIAFAVSIGALIMNWSSSGEVIEPIKKDSCDAMNLNLVSFCQNQNELSLTLKNSGAVNIEKVILRAEINGLNLDYFIPSSTVAVNGEKAFTIPKSTLNISNNVKVIPVMVSGNNELVCRTKLINQLQIPDC